MLHNFTGAPDGENPEGGLVDVDGKLYGTTIGSLNVSGNNLCSDTNGNVFIPTSAYVILEYEHGGTYPIQTLHGGDIPRTLYGTTREGGSSACKYGCGTAYSIMTTGTEQVVYRFAGGRDGALPQAGLINVNGALYGTTVSGGGTSCVDQFYFGYHGCGTIYKLTTSGDEKVQFRFKSEYVGEPAASLVNVGSVLFGTTPRVSNRKCGVHGMTCGTVFAVTL